MSTIKRMACLLVSIAGALLAALPASAQQVTGTLAFNNFSGVGRPGVGTLKVNGNVVATRKMEKTLPIILQWDESLDIGSDTLTGVNDADYQPSFALTAKLNKLTIEVDRPQLSPKDVKKLQAAMQEKAKRD